MDFSGDVRFSPKSDRTADISACLKCADIVAKVFLGRRTKILRAADAFYARRREGPYRFIQNRSRTSVVALKSDAAAEKSKDQLSRHFPGRSIFDFCNNICQKQTCLTNEIAKGVGSARRCYDAGCRVAPTSQSCAARRLMKPGRVLLPPCDGEVSPSRRAAIS
jgi:hypothetical protein